MTNENKFQDKSSLCKNSTKEISNSNKQIPKRNFQIEMEKIIEQNRKNSEIPSLLLHSCCAPCSSYVLETLSEDFQITVFYYNPNIYPEEEYWKRVEEQKEFIRKLPAKHPISFLEGNYDRNRFYESVKGLEKIPEGGERCFACFALRLGESVRVAKEGNFNYVTTTLTISPLKNAQKLNEIGETLCQQNNLKWLPSDFKKKNGYKRSTELSKEYGMYRQDYCGCVFSLQESNARKAEHL